MQPAEPKSSYLVQAADLATARTAVEAVGGAVTHELAIINSVGAQLTANQQAMLATREEISLVVENSNLAVSGGPSQPDTFFPSLIGAAQLHQAGITGDGVTVAVVDTGIWHVGALKSHIAVQYDAIANKITTASGDASGHGTHISAIIASDARSKGTNLYNGIAPDVNLVNIIAFDKNGTGNYLDVIRGIDWAVSHKDEYNIRVMNLSFSATPQSYYWDDPINQAVMRAWQAGIVVVAAAGNSGPNPMTIGVPGNVPYVITVGAMANN